MYRYVNVNPKGRREEDCVCRAISLATGDSYYKVKDKLELTSRLYECDTLCVCCYKSLLDNVYKFQRINDFKGYKVKELCRFLPKGIFIVRVKGHLTCIIDNEINDIWDCGNEVVDIVWCAQKKEGA